MNKNVTIIGIGNMGNAIAHALIDKKIIPEKNLTLANPSFIGHSAFKETKVNLISNNKQAIESADIIILAVKPQNVQTVFTEIIPNLSSGQLIISIAAGISMHTLKKMSGNKKQPIIRCMPNLCLNIGESMTAWIKSSEVTVSQEASAIKIFNSFGQQFMLDQERFINTVTAISGSGPAYVFYLTEILEDTAQKLGIPAGFANILARQTVIGSANLLKFSKETALSLRQAVTSKGGTTEAAFTVFEKDKLQKTFFNGILAAEQRAKQLNK